MKSVTVPDLVGLSQEEAEDALTDAALKLGEVGQELVAASSERLNTVLLQDPRSGTEVDSGTEVVLVVAATSEDGTVSPAAGSGVAQSTPNSTQRIVEAVFPSLASASSCRLYIDAPVSGKWAFVLAEWRSVKLQPAPDKPLVPTN